VGPKELESFKKLPSLDREARDILVSADIVSLARRGGANNYTEIVKKYGVRWAKTPLLKEALGNAAFQLVEPEFKRYEKTKIDYKYKENMYFVQDHKINICKHISSSSSSKAKTTTKNYLHSPLK